jgi:SulP family sulfate permease
MKKLHQSIFAALSVALVVITLGAAFGLLSGRGAFIGIISTAVVTLVTAFVGGTKYGVTAPTGPMTAAIAVILASDSKFLETHTSALSSAELLSLTIIFAALIVFIMSLLRVHKLIRFIPHLVISGFVNGIALLIIISQIKSIVTKTDLVIVIFSFLLLLVFNEINKIKNHPAIKLIANSFMVIVIVTVIVNIFSIPASTLSLSTKFSDLSISFPSLSGIDFQTYRFIFFAALELAIIAILDTLLTSVIMDEKTKLESDHRRELFGQSLSLASVSLFGGIPGAQSTAPSMMLYKEGGNHKLTKLYLALFCIALTLLSSFVIPFLPSAVFGGIIIKVALDIADLTSLKTVIRCKNKVKFVQLFVILGTAVSTVLVSLNFAVVFFTVAFVTYNKFSASKYYIPDLEPYVEQEGLIDES